MSVLVSVCGCIFCFCNQETAYEMRISDWSSDVCSSDLRLLRRQRVVGADDLVAIADIGARPQEQRAVIGHMGQEVIGIAGHHLDMLGGDLVGDRHHLCIAVGDDHLAEILPRLAGMVGGRSEAHTPELQSLMRISYAV